MVQCIDIEIDTKSLNITNAQIEKLTMPLKSYYFLLEWILGIPY